MQTLWLLKKRNCHRKESYTYIYICMYVCVTMCINLHIWFWSLCWKDPLEKAMATDSSILTWRIPMDRGAWWATGSMGSQRAEQDSATKPGICVSESLCRTPGTNTTLQTIYTSIWRRDFLCRLALQHILISRSVPRSFPFHMFLACALSRQFSLGI